VARRSDIDWEKVQRLYVAGPLTIRQIADECGIHISSITAKAKSEQWQRNLSEAIKQRTKAKVAQIDVQQIIEQSATESAQKSAQLIKTAVEEAANVVAGVVIRHRADIREQHERAKRLESLFDAVVDRIKDSPCADNDEEGGLSTGDVFKLSQTLKAIVETRTKLIDKERQSYGIEDANTGESEDNSPVEIQVNLVGTNAKD
jgi:hypothetical protein